MYTKREQMADSLFIFGLFATAAIVWYTFWVAPRDMAMEMTMACVHDNGWELTEATWGTCWEQSTSELRGEQPLTTRR